MVRILEKNSPQNEARVGVKMELSEEMDRKTSEEMVGAYWQADGGNRIECGSLVRQKVLGTGNDTVTQKRKNWTK